MSNPPHSEIIAKAHALIQGGQLHSAIAMLIDILKEQPTNQQAIRLMAYISSALPDKEEAIQLLSICLQNNPPSPFLLYELGSIYLNLGKYTQAIDALNQALQKHPDYFEALHDLGAALALTGQKEEAFNKLLLASKINNQSADLYYNLGRLCDERFEYKQAIGFYQDALRLHSSYTEAWVNLAIDLAAFKKYADALNCFEKAYALNPNLAFLYGDCAFMRMRMCEWGANFTELSELTKKISNGEKVISPFPLMALIDLPSLIQKAAKIYTESKYPPDSLLGPINQNNNQKIRIAYFSADFHEHPVSYLTAELFELHNRNYFEIYAFSFGKNTNDAMRKRLEKSFDHFIDASDKTPLEICSSAREAKIDIAIDLAGYTENARTEIFALRAAPVQISYIGFLGTMGAQYMDYLIADEVIIPPHLRQFYSEKIIFLPSYQANDSKRAPSAKIFTKAEFGIKEDQFVFCNLNDVYKITPSIFNGWMKILSLSPNSVLLLYSENSWAQENLIQQAIKQEIDPARLIFLDRLPRADYLSRYLMADLFLDTSPYNAGTTASDALWMGLPVITLQGNTFSSRVASSLLINLDLSELIHQSIEGYENQAIDLATHPKQFQAIKNKLLRNKQCEPLFNSKLFIQHLEAAYKKVYLHYKEKYPLKDIFPKDYS